MARVATARLPAAATPRAFRDGVQPVHTAALATRLLLAPALSHGATAPAAWLAEWLAATYPPLAGLLWRVFGVLLQHADDMAALRAAAMVRVSASGLWRLDAVGAASPLAPAARTLTDDATLDGRSYRGPWP